MSNIELLTNIRKLQLKQDSKYFKKGLFPSYRKNKVLGLIRPDDNIFFSISVLFILQSLSSKFTSEEMSILKDIEDDLLPNINRYSNKPERNSYNFWEKNNGKHFPNGKLLNRIGKFQLPDDIDTTSLIQMVSHFNIEEATVTKKVLPSHANGYRLNIKNGHECLRKFAAYSTWFGANMPIEFDVCVFSNYLLWLNHFGFEKNKNDLATIDLIKETIIQSLYFVSSFKSAPEYPNTSVILYHLARLVSKTDTLNDVKEKLIIDIKKHYKDINHPFERMFLQSSLLKMGVVLKDCLEQEANLYVNKYWWFTAGFLSVYSNAIIKKLAPCSVFHYRFVCPSFNLALILENRLLKI